MATSSSCYTRFFCFCFDTTLSKFDGSGRLKTPYLLCRTPSFEASFSLSELLPGISLLAVLTAQASLGAAGGPSLIWSRLLDLELLFFLGFFLFLVDPLSFEFERKMLLEFAIWMLFTISSPCSPLSTDAPLGNCCEIQALMSLRRCSGSWARD